MFSHARSLCLTTIVLGLSLGLGLSGSCALAPRDNSEVGAGRSELRDRILEIARRYATFEWTATEANVWHGQDEDGVRVDTPDRSFDGKGWSADGSINRGMPYAWGGFSTIEEFHTGLERGLYAGLVPVTERARSSRHALGLDCSGFVARCWQLPVKQSTRSLGRLCYELNDCSELQPGDILNKFDSHVVLFKEWGDEDQSVMRVIEAASLGVEENEYATELLLTNGFVPMRFMPLDAKWVPMTLGVPEFMIEGSMSAGQFAAVEHKPMEPRPDPLLLADTEAGDWARYRVTDTWGVLPSEYSMIRKAANVEGGQLFGQCVIDVRGEQLPSGSKLSLRASLSEVLVDFAAFETPLGELQIASCEVLPGRYDWNNRTFEAQSLSIVLRGSFVNRHKEFPLTLEVDSVLSDEVSLHGILQAEYRMTVEFEDGQFERKRTFTLHSFG